MKYPKINTIWKRDEKNKFNIIEGDFSKEEFKAIHRWSITEKVDGTNIRVIFDRGSNLEPKFRGRTDKAQIPNFLMNFLKSKFTRELMLKVFPDSQKIILFGEGYGNKIQSVGKKYRDDNSLILFDVCIDDWWLEQDNVNDIAKKLGIWSVPLLKICDIKEALDYVKSEPDSQCSAKNLKMEGIVARSHPLMLFRDGTPIMWKIKAKDYRKLNAPPKSS